MKIAFLLDNAYGIGGTIRSTVNLSRALAARHTVEVVSLRRPTASPALPFDARVTLTPLLDLRPDSPGYDGDDPLFHRPSHRFTERPGHFERGLATRLGDVRTEAYLRDTDADVVIATRPKLLDYLARYGSSRYLRAGQEHLTRRMHSEHVRTHQDAAIRELDAFVTVSYADAADYRSALPGDRQRHTPVLCIPNPVPATGVEPTHGDSKLIVAAGRLVRIKRYDRLLDAFALVCEEHPDWRLRLYGRGKLHADLRAQINRLGLYDRAFLMGPHSPLESEWAKAAVAAVSSDAESFGIGLVEAMHCGVPVVSTNCPHGPGEIVTHGRDGLLTPLGDEQESVRAYADDLLKLIENPGLRQRMGLAARQKAQRYTPTRIAAEYEQLITDLQTGRTPGTATRVPSAQNPPRPSVAPGPEPGGPGTGTEPLHRLAHRAVRRTVRRLTDRPAKGQPPREDAATPSAPPGAPRPRARTRVGADGTVVIRLRASRVPDGQAVLVLRARHRDGVPDIRLPLPDRSEAAGGWVQVQLERAEHRLEEARWDCFVERASDGARRRVHSELVETARLLAAPAPVDPDGCLTPWVPYTTSHGYLAVRAWRRPGHAEVTDIELGPRGFTVRAELYGKAALRAGGGAKVTAEPRRHDDHDFELPVAAVHTESSPPTLSFELPYDLPAALDRGEGDAVWQLRLQPEHGGETGSFRFGRLLGDLADRRKTDVLPTARLADSDTGVRLSFSLTNDLTLGLRPLAADERREKAGQQPASGTGTPDTAPAEGRAAGGESRRPGAGA